MREFQRHLILACTTTTLACGTTLNINDSEPTTVRVDAGPEQILSTPQSETSPSSTELGASVGPSASDGDTSTDAPITSTTRSDAGAGGATATADGLDASAPAVDASTSSAEETSETQGDAAPSPYLCKGEAIELDYHTPERVAVCDAGTCLSGFGPAAPAPDGTVWMVAGTRNDEAWDNLAGFGLYHFAADATLLSSDLLHSEQLEPGDAVTYWGDVSVDADGELWITVVRNTQIDGNETTSLEVQHLTANGSPLGDPIAVGSDSEGRLIPISQRVAPDSRLLVALRGGVMSVAANGDIARPFTLDSDLWLAKGELDAAGAFVGLEGSLDGAGNQKLALVSYSATGEKLWSVPADESGAVTRAIAPLNDGSSVELFYPPGLGFGGDVQFRRRSAAGEVTDDTLLTSGGFEATAWTNPRQDATGALLVGGPLRIGNTSKTAIFKVDGSECTTYVLPSFAGSTVRDLRVGWNGDLIATNGDLVAFLQLP